MYKYILIFLVLCFIKCHVATGQDLAHLGDKKPFTFHGNIGLGTTFYTSDEPYAVRDPFAWNLFGNFTPAVYGFDFPFTLLITQFSRSYTQPFSQMEISPHYKWITLHAGYRNIQLSPLVFGSTSFLGGGIELTPGWLRFAAFYGRLNKAINQDTTADHRMQPQYERIGFGGKIGIAGKGQEFSLQYFYAKDKEQSIKNIIDSVVKIMPQENVVLGSSWKFTFFKRLHFDGHIAASVLSQDTRYQQIDSIGDIAIPSFVEKMLPVRYSSVLSFAGQARLALSLKNANFGTSYRRSQPDFKSLGTPYSLNDIELINATAGVRFLKGKLSLNSSYARQRNNLDGSKGSTLQSQNGNLTISSFMNKHFTLNTLINLVHIYQKDGAIRLNDSMRMNQLMLAVSLAPSFNFQTEKLQHNIATNISYTGLDDRNPVTKSTSNGTNLNTSINYGVYVPGLFMGLNLGLNYSSYNQSMGKFNAVGVNLGANAQFLKEHNLSLNGNIGYFLNQSTYAPVNNNLTFSAGCNYTQKKHNFGLFASYLFTPPVDLDPMNKVNNVPYFVNTYSLSGGVNYSYSF